MFRMILSPTSDVLEFDSTPNKSRSGRFQSLIIPGESPKFVIIEWSISTTRYSARNVLQEHRVSFFRILIIQVIK